MADSFVDYIRRKRGYGGPVSEEEKRAVDTGFNYSGYTSNDRGMGGGWGSAAAAEAARAGRTGSTAGSTSGSSSGGFTRSGIGSDYVAGGGNYGSGMYSGGVYSQPRSVPTTTISATGSTTGTSSASSIGGRYVPGGGAEAARPLQPRATTGGGAGYGPYGGSGTGSRPARNFSGSGFGGFGSTSSRIMNDLRSDFNFTREQAAGVVGNLAHESGGFTSYQEGKPVSGRGGAGWAQWTGDRRNAFESWAKENNLDTRSYAANYGFLKHELNTDYKGTIASLRKTQTPQQAMYAFEQGFERAGVKHYGSRLKYANAAYNGAPYEGTVPGGDADLRALQTSLNERGANIIVDGIMGPQTRNAMKQYQMGGPAYGTAPPSAFPGVSSGTRAMYTGGNSRSSMGQSFSGGGSRYGSVGSRLGGGSGYGGAGIGQGTGGAINPNK